MPLQRLREGEVRVELHIGLKHITGLLREIRLTALIDIFYLNTLRQVIPGQMLPNLILPHNTSHVHTWRPYLFLHFLIHVPRVADRRRLCPSGVQSYVNGSLDSLKFAPPSH